MWRSIGHVALRSIIYIGLVLFVVVVLGAVAPYFLSGGACSTTNYVPTLAPQESSPEGISYTHKEIGTYIRFPEWFIVWSSVGYADFIKGHNPSAYPYLTEIGQFWCSYKALTHLTNAAGYSFSLGSHVMIFVIGTSFSIEYEIRFVYENTIGGLTEWFVGSTKTEEDIYGAVVAEEYAKFLFDHAWYDYPFLSKVSGVWQTSWWGNAPLRKWERKIVLTFEYLVKSAYGTLISGGTHTAYTPDASQLYLKAKHASDAIIRVTPNVSLISRDANGSVLLETTQYGAFMETVTTLASRGVQFMTFEGNNKLSLSVVSPASWIAYPAGAHEVFSMRISTKPELKRIFFSVEVPDFAEVLNDLTQKRVTIEHIYDF
jgi:hypothetical protein